jgi:hypothetical protein
MEYGSVFGHGAYLGPDFTADYLRRSTDIVRESYGGSESDAAARRTAEDFRANTYDEETETVTLSEAESNAYRELVGHYSDLFSEQPPQKPAGVMANQAPAHVLLRVDGLGGVHRAPRARLHVHEQLAAELCEKADAESRRRHLADLCWPDRLHFRVQPLGRRSAGENANSGFRSARPATWR